MRNAQRERIATTTIAVSRLSLPTLSSKTPNHLLSGRLQISPRWSGTSSLPKSARAPAAVITQKSFEGRGDSQGKVYLG